MAERVAQILETASGTPYEAINTTKGFMVVDPDEPMLPDRLKPPVKIEKIEPDTNMGDLQSVENAGETIIVNNNDYSQQNQSVANQTDVHSGSLDTNIDSYFDRVALNARGYN